jgi:hypothetical protein
MTAMTDGDGNIITQGQKPMATSLPVVIASDQGAIPVSFEATEAALPENAAKEQSGNLEDIAILLRQLICETRSTRLMMASVFQKDPGDFDRNSGEIGMFLQ